MTIAITLKHFNLTWTDVEKVFSYIYPEDVKKGEKIPGSSEWTGNIRFQWVRESRTFKSAKYYDAVQAEIEVEEGEESVEYKKYFADVVDAMGALGIRGRLAGGERKVLDFRKK
ncbi:hypothetical protein HII31_10327 [Pseudocercospora fuligena]|uniref:Uncharacterized protein n=1 Tax=Pseudocercospora fuligena TaxID=685502 RepID=A0A8H6VDF9_9PEZI|nr:hypothetical protein HII31_10327 [Pseudocercospora fuligena]